MNKSTKSGRVGDYPELVVDVAAVNGEIYHVSEVNIEILSIHGGDDITNGLSFRNRGIVVAFDDGRTVVVFVFNNYSDISLS